MTACHDDFEQEFPLAVLCPVTLPCGRVIPNRLVKAAMYEHGSTLLGEPPNEFYHSLYTRSSKGRWGMIITGNVQVSSTHLTLDRDMVVPTSLTSQTTESFKSLAAAIHSSSPDTLAIMQLSHVGRQSPNVLGGRFPFLPPLAPSAVQLGSTNRRSSPVGQLVYNCLFQTPRQMSTEDVDNVVIEFVRGAKLAAESGFNGVELHAWIIDLLAQFISPKVSSSGFVMLRPTTPFLTQANKRSDEYSLGDALHLLRRIVSSICVVVPPTFAIAADYADDDSGANNEKGYFNEISGGDSENPKFMEAGSSPPSNRQSLFSKFSKQAMSVLPTHAETDSTTLPSDTRPPHPSNRFLDRAWRRLDRILGMLRLIGAGLGMAWYVVMTRRMVEDQGEGGDLGGVDAVVKMWLWTTPSVKRSMGWGYGRGR
ncbi:hypothetical protein JAAARDRAFT_192850 [Jaapia argillacea MUCL 33604]|uniref:NADH:flavin oxidoreductase/NADH oxidase N-terminal domain-containing protein n=1 Tax=Jaapia argillacea MUCL 33604 TaxID=933084 RepID=A0A067Q9U4_9AGAM|nr:hypothetical protein JAAARDRAFT_192850 [Jaapia argillacea MUCL 33604]